MLRILEISRHKVSHVLHELSTALFFFEKGIIDFVPSFLSESSDTITCATVLMTSSRNVQKYLSFYLIPNTRVCCNYHSAFVISVVVFQ